ncbi:hypothetical protein [Hyphomicrobium sp. 2TAF46]|uniref:hypothetical protein n=1 Tax=Hyphomicrobium sp. 2TAF46 TaxID=3233019 RepID=UPI003F8E7012
MKKSSRDARNRRRAQTVDEQDILRQLAAAFEKKFGRPPGPDDPVFFDSDADKPRKLAMEKFDKNVLAAMQASGIAPQIIYAFKKTGRLLREDLISTYPPEAVAEWEAAIDEYFAMEDSPEYSASEHPPKFNAPAFEPEGEMESPANFEITAEAAALPLAVADIPHAEV